MVSRKISNEINSFRICIDHYENGIVQGRIYLISQDSSSDFTGILELMKLMEQIMDDNSFPQAGMQLRRFLPQRENVIFGQVAKENPFANNPLHGGVATYRVRILFRQNATWQGIICWIEKGVEEHFRSALEFMMLIDSTISSQSKMKKGKQRAINE